MWRVGVRVELDHAVMVGEPDRMRVPRVQVWIFQQAQAPALGGLWSAATAQPVAAVVGIAAQVFPRQRRAVEVQRVEIGGGGIPVLGARFGDRKSTRLNSSH